VPAELTVTGRTARLERPRTDSGREIATGTVSETGRVALTGESVGPFRYDTRWEGSIAEGTAALVGVHQLVVAVNGVPQRMDRPCTVRLQRG
jgi:hypothetical protein